MIADNVRSVLDTIRETAVRSGRNPSEITIVAVTKNHSVHEIEQAIEAGIMHFGENRVQEAMGKIPSVIGSAVWHMVGHLQSNKGKQAAILFDWVDSVDSIKITDVLSNWSQKARKTLKVLIQVNITGEQTKSGILPCEVKNLVTYAMSRKGLDVCGLMTIGSFGVSPDVTRAEFSKMRNLFDTLRADNQVGSRMGILSMGMSDDYHIAVEQGATMVRIGTAIFGPRI